MHWGLPISFMIHVVILIMAVRTLPAPEEFKVKQQESIPVEIVSPEQLSKRATMVKKPEPKPKPEPPKKKPAPIKVEKRIEKIEPAPEPAKEIKQAAKPPEPQPEPPKPDPIKDLIDRTEPAPEPDKPVEKVKRAHADPAPKPRKKPNLRIKIAKKKKKKKDFNLDQISALLNKTDDSRQAPPEPDDPGKPLIGDHNITGNDERISANELDWLRQRIGQCWNVPAGARDARNLIVKVHFQMTPDGRVLGQPRVLNHMDHPVFAAAARNALSAVIGCQPYDKLPPEKYDSWKVLILNFDPSKMLALN